MGCAFDAFFYFVASHACVPSFSVIVKGLLRGEI